MGQSASHKTCFPICSKIDYINAKTRDGHDAFSLARIYDHEQIIEELFKHLSLDNLKWEENDKLIFDRIYKAILAEDLDILDSYPVWLVINENTGETILHIASAMGCATTVLHLLQRQYTDHHRPNVIFLREKHHGFTPLLSAAYAGQSKCFEHILTTVLKVLTTENYPDTFVRDVLIDRCGRTLLHLCVLSRQTNILEILMLAIESNPFLFVQFIEPMIFALNYNDETPLHLAVRLNLYDMCQLLLLFSDKLDEIQQPCIYLDTNDGELIRSINMYTNHIQFIPSSMLSLLTESSVYIIGYKNKTGQSSFHIAILYGHKDLLNLFLEHVHTSGMNYLLEHTDSDIRTPLHLACLKGHNQIVEEFFFLNVNIYTRDAEESTPLHCVAQCIDGTNACVYILDLFLKYIQNCKKISFDLLTAIDGFGHNCLETAILARNRPFVEYLLNLNNIPLFKNLLRNAQSLDIYNREIDTPLRKLVKSMPDLAYRVLDICITNIGNKHKGQFKIIYDFEFLEDHCFIQQWQHHIPTERTSCRYNLLEFRSQFHSQSLIAYTRNPYILIHNNVLSVMCECAKKIDLKDREEDNNHIQHCYRLMHHPLCEKLMEIKWKQFGLPLFLISFFIYCLYLILFTITMLRNKQPEYFYRLINASFPNGRYSTENQLVRFLFI
jgi:ankyrin repeat protein